MRGHEKLIAMRLAGKAPSAVFLNDFPEKVLCREWHNPGERYGQVWETEHPQICVHGDPISSLDLRFLQGMTVHINSTSEARAKALFAKAKWFGAKTIGAVHTDETKPYLKQSGWTEIWRQENGNS